MASEISILRKFLSMDLNLGLLSFNDRSKDHIQYISQAKTKSLIFGNWRVHYHILYICNGNDMHIVDGNIPISNEQDFLDYDDIH